MSEEQLAAALTTIQDLQEKLEKSEALVSEMSAVEDRLQDELNESRTTIGKLQQDIQGLTETQEGLREDARLAIEGKDIALNSFRNQQRMHGERQKDADNYWTLYQMSQETSALLRDGKADEANAKAKEAEDFLRSLGHRIGKPKK